MEAPTDETLEPIVEAQKESHIPVEPDRPRAMQPHDQDISELRLTKRIFQKFGFSTDNGVPCMGCEHVQKNLYPRSHSDACRKRMYNLLGADDNEKEALERALDRMLLKTDGNEVIHREPKSSEAASSAAQRKGTPTPTDCSIPEPDPLIPETKEEIDTPSAEIGPLNQDIPLAMEPDSEDDLDMEVHLHDEMAEDPRNEKRNGEVLEADEDDEKPQEKRPRTAIVQQLFSIMERPKVRKIIEQLEQEIFKSPKNRRQRRSRDQLEAKSHVGELYSPPRMAKAAEKLGMSACWSLDLTVMDSDGAPWDFTVPEKKAKAKQMLDRDRPALLVVSPMCGPFSSWQEINFSHERARDQRDPSPSPRAPEVLS
jgi:hypothetical protein